MKKSFIIFDLDGTLFDTLPDLAGSVNAALETNGLFSLPVSQIKSYIGRGAKNIIRRSVGACIAQLSGNLDFDMPEDGVVPEGVVKVIKEKWAGNLPALANVYQSYLDHYITHCAVNTTIYPGVYEFLKRNFRAALLTNKNLDQSLCILDHFKLRGRFEQIVGGDTVKAKKPAPDGILQILEKAGVAKEDAVIIGDDTNDLLAAREALIDCVMHLNGYREREKILAYEPKYTIEHFTELLDLFE
ncbi:MAG: HAD-IA family hydrolase [Fibrobacteraceae bacterium]|nr:HAD-IA family hydrolase [Fibrobacteraceae bacterium]